MKRGHSGGDGGGDAGDLCGAVMAAEHEEMKRARQRLQDRADATRQVAAASQAVATAALACAARHQAALEDHDEIMERRRCSIAWLVGGGGTVANDHGGDGGSGSGNGDESQTQLECDATQLE